jgi:PTH1 family peptidyl-tRNA hydrolase
LVVGLGNPGAQYERTRHNAGFAVLGRLAARHGARFRRSWLGARGETAQIQLGGTAVTLLRPLTFMNLSGEAVRPLLRREGLAPEDILLVYDDMDLPPGRLRLRAGGGSGGHRGVASVISAAGSEAVGRVRVGIGRPAPGVDAAEYVLSVIPPDGRAAWEQALERAADAVEVVCRDGLEAAMARFNGA